MHGKPSDQYYYGGDFGDIPNDGEFALNGLTTPDRRVTAKLLEVKNVYQYVAFKPLSVKTGRISIRNKYDFLNLDVFDITWEMLRDGTVNESGVLPSLDLPPGEETVITVPFQERLEPGHEYMMNVYLTLKEDSRWAKPGHQVASAQFPVTLKQPVFPVDRQPLDRVTVENEEGKLVIGGNGFRTVFDPQTAMMTSLRYDGKEMIHQGQGPSFNWYRSINNDKYAGQKYVPTHIRKDILEHTVHEDGKAVTVTTVLQADIHSGQIIRLPFTIRYTVYANGMIDVDAMFDTPKAGTSIHRLGLQMALVPGMEDVQWYGRGPHENYRDRKKSAFIGLYRSDVQDMEEHYIRPQSIGNREDIRWLSITDRQAGIKISARTGLSFSALHFTDQDLWDTAHDFELDRIRKPEVFLNLDCIQQGVGNASCGPLPLPQYNLPENTTVSYSFRIEPVRNGN